MHPPGLQPLTRPCEILQIVPMTTPFFRSSSWKHNLAVCGMPTWSLPPTSQRAAAVLGGLVLLACSNGTTPRDNDGMGGSGAPIRPTPREVVDVPMAPTDFGTPTMVGSGSSGDRYAKADVERNGTHYRFIANGWGPGFESHSLSWNGTSFVVETMNGSQGDNYEPASYPSLFCGRYSDSTSMECGLPRALNALTSVRTGWKWQPNGNTGEYNAAYDVWIGDASGNLSGYLMVWLRDPSRQQPAGKLTEFDVTDINGLPGTWDIWTGMVNGRPITNYVRPEDADVTEIQFDMMDVIRDATARGYMVPGDTLMSVAIGFEIWNGPVENLQTLDFYVGVQ